MGRAVTWDPESWCWIATRISNLRQPCLVCLVLAWGHMALLLYLCRVEGLGFRIMQARGRLSGKAHLFRIDHRLKPGLLSHGTRDCARPCRASCICSVLDRGRTALLLYLCSPWEWVAEGLAQQPCPTGLNSSGNPFPGVVERGWVCPGAWLWTNLEMLHETHGASVCTGPAAMTPWLTSSTHLSAGSWAQCLNSRLLAL